jgi:hypothetical protein
MSLKLTAKSNAVTFSSIQKFLSEVHSKVKFITILLLDIQTSSTVDTNFVWGQGGIFHGPDVSRWVSIHKLTMPPLNNVRANFLKTFKS